jgi:1-acyl-sn-glycerol-3-phosphate acyltransferase
MALAGDVPVRRGAHGSGHAALATCARWVERGMPVIIFPEGTRSKDGALGPFKDGAFKLAIETGADVLPLGISGTHEAMPKHSWRVGRSRGRLVAGAPIASAGKTVAQLKAEVRAAVERLVQEASQAE